MSSARTAFGYDHVTPEGTRAVHCVLGTTSVSCRAVGSSGLRGGWRRTGAFSPGHSINTGPVPCSRVQRHRLPAKARGAGGTGPVPRSLTHLPCHRFVGLEGDGDEPVLSRFGVRSTRDRFHAPVPLRMFIGSPTPHLAPLPRTRDMRRLGTRVRSRTLRTARDFCGIARASTARSATRHRTRTHQ